MGDIMGHKDRQIWSPSHVLQDPLFDDHSNKQQQDFINNYHHHHHNGSGIYHQPGEFPLKESFPLYYGTSQNQQSHWQRSNGGDRMQAFFLVPPGRKTSGGTGVFLPTIASHPLTKKPACSPVLLPTRVVRALNLNVHNNGVHMSPCPEIRENDSRKKSEMLVPPMKIEVETPIDSPEKLLPEEWIY